MTRSLRLPLRRYGWSISLIALGCCCVCGRQLQLARGAYLASLGQLERASQLAARISVLRQQPDLAASKSQSERTLAEAIEVAAQGAGIDKQQIARIEPQAPRRAGESDFMEHGTIVQVDGIVLTQIPEWLNRLKTGELQQLRVTAARITAPYQGQVVVADAETWNFELTLTYFVYSPNLRRAASP